MTSHLDLDALADRLAEPSAEDPTSTHLAGCAPCRGDLEALRAASERISADLAGLPAPVLPADLAERLASSLVETQPAGGGTVTTLPERRTPQRRWLPAAAAVVLLLAGAGFALSRLGGHGGGSSTSAAGAPAATGKAVDVVRNSSGTDYTSRATLAAAVPQLLTGSANGALTAQAPVAGAAPQPSSADAQTRAAVDPLARLRDNAGLAECLLALLPPDDPSARPLAIDYASFRGAPAMVVVLPSTLPGKLDVFVVGPGCSRANDSTLFYASVDKP